MHRYTTALAAATTTLLVYVSHDDKLHKSASDGNLILLRTIVLHFIILLGKAMKT